MLSAQGKKILSLKLYDHPTIQTIPILTSPALPQQPNKGK